MPILVALAMSSITACGIKKKAGPSAAALTTLCQLPNDQTGTLIANWKVGPVPVAFEADAASGVSKWAPLEMSMHIASFDGWNQFFTASKGGKIFDYGNATNPYTIIKPPGACLERIATPGGFIGKVSIHKVTSGWSFGTNVIALTSLCYDPGTPLRSFYGATMNFNYVDFGPVGGSNPNVPDWQTIALHEQGHLVGLDHSCEDPAPGGSAKAGMPRCTNGNPVYNAAVMFPVLFDGQAVVRQTLDQNTQARANCLY